MRTKKEIQKEIDDCNQRIKQLREEMNVVERKKSKKSSDSYYKRKEMLERASVEIEKILEPGMFIKVTGSRAGPLKHIIAFRQGKTNGGWVIVNSCYVRKFRDEDGKIKHQTQVDISGVTEHGTEKITEVFVDGRWKKAKEFLDD